MCSGVAETVWLLKLPALLAETSGLARMLREGGPKMIEIYCYYNQLRQKCTGSARLHIVLFGFMNNLASHLGRSPLIHSYGYESAGDRPTCFTSLPLKSKSFVQHPG